MNMPENLMTVKEVADYLRLGDRHVRRLIKSGDISHLRIGYGRGHVRVTPEQLQEYIKSKSEIKTS
jgi:excisionase family DNA binding protein